MLTLLVLIICLFVGTAPLNLSFVLLSISMWVSTLMMIYNGNLFPASAMIISYSTGMMVLFCYCSMLVSFESKNLTKLYYLMLMLLLFIMSSNENPSEMTNMSNSAVDHQVQFLIMAIGLVTLSMVSVNKSMFNPSKSSMMLY